ncbi:MAG: SsrA-binding protein [Lentisphaerae bacterium GWF2_44_16]|nr:MAG: SsrA-binding protein [Lentisphaerae bacterium GWF2_44_16]
MAEKDKKSDNVLIKNKKAFHDYAILETFEAGIELKGTEVKSCRQNSIALVDSFVKIENGQATLLNCHISPYTCGNRFNHETLRPRRLLLHKAEIRKLAIQLREKGNTIIPLKFYLKNGKVKLEIGVAKGKTHGDKREAMRRSQDERDVRREMSRR